MLLAAAFLSGVAGLIFELAWFHRAGLVFGSSVWSTSLVLSAFMGGLMLGSALITALGGRIGRPGRTYALAELVVAVTGAGLTWSLPAFTDVVVRVTAPGDGGWWTNALRFVVAFALLLIPSTAMGTTLPLLVSRFNRRAASTTQRFGQALGLVYGANTLGAVAGVLLAEFLLIGALGIGGTALAASACSIAAAALIAFVVGDSGVATPARDRLRDVREMREMLAMRRPNLALLTAACLSGALLLALEVVWFRFLTQFVLSTTAAAALMLAVVLLGIALGGVAGGRWLQMPVNLTDAMPVIACAGGLAVLACYVGFNNPWLTVQTGRTVTVLAYAGVLCGAPAFLSGVLFTLLGAAVRHASDSDERAAGWLTLANTGGGMLGPLVAAFVLLPSAGTEGTFITLATGYLLVAGACVAASRSAAATPPSNRAPSLALSAIAILLAASVLLPFAHMRDRYETVIAAPYLQDGSEIIARRDGPSENILLLQQRWLGDPVYTRLVTNGFSMSGTAMSARRYMRGFVYLPLVLHRGPLAKVLLICYGVGATAAAALDVPSLTSLDVAEISADITAMSPLIHRDKDPLADARTRLHIEDGRQFLAATSERFDLITGEPPPPRTPGTSTIYSREFFELMRNRLNDGGMASYWIPVGRPDPGTNVNGIMRAFCDVFTDCTLWNATPFDLIIIGTRRGTPPPGEDDFVRPWTIPALRARFVEVGYELPQQVGATFVGDADYVRTLTAGASLLDDDHPRRLVPQPGQPSISDSGYGSDRAVTQLYQSVFDPVRARTAFSQSTIIRDLIPERVREASLAYFEQQKAMNDVFWEGGDVRRHLVMVDRLLTQTPLRTLPLWLLGSDAVREGIARRRDDGGGAVMAMRALSLLADRDYKGAANAFAMAEQRGLRDDTMHGLRAYALARAGEREASIAVQPLSAGDAVAQAFWRDIAAIRESMARPAASAAAAGGER